MSVLNWLSGLFVKKTQPINYHFTDSDRDKALSVRRAKNETAELEEKLKQELIKLDYESKKESLLTEIAEAKHKRQELLEELYENDEEPDKLNADTLIMQLLTNVMNKSNSQPAPTVQTPTYSQPTSTVGVSFTEQQIDEMIMSLNPMQKGALYSLEPTEKEKLIRTHIPNITDECVSRIMQRFK